MISIVKYGLRTTNKTELVLIEYSGSCGITERTLHACYTALQEVMYKTSI